MLGLQIVKQGTDVFKILQGGQIQWRRLPQGHVLTWKGLGESWRVLEGPDNLSYPAVLASIVEGERFFYKTKNVVGGSQRMYLRAYGAWRVLKGPGGS